MVFLSAVMSALAAGVVSMHRWIIGMWHPGPVLHDNAIGDYKNHFTAQCAPDKSSTRTFDRGDTPTPPLELLNHRIRALEPLERSLAERYGLDEYFDSVDVFQIAKARALSTNDDQTGRDLHCMDELYQLRLRRAQILMGELPAS
ncbi:hypothetical protein EDD18DRAFT_668472 [Armillaria luteobubalina]|uniref:Uncharacterized protein n=1 Tax=Armillaria luteobubalina TaxID=153913 RepID=A0AA39PM25_9AGAR|nr:hypothetical protein EDD18DRAFT_668472 [Armillaria luteobubalina]